MPDYGSLLQFVPGDRVLIVAPPQVMKKGGRGSPLTYPTRTISGGEYGPISASRLVRIAWEALPPFEPGSQEQAEASELWFLSKLSTESGLPLVQRPFRAPHHTVSPMGLVGSAYSSGGEHRATRAARLERLPAAPTPTTWHYRPGEVSLAHGGVLLLDDVLEFSGQAIDTVAVALRDGVSTIIRGWGTPEGPQRVDLPARPYAVAMTTTPEDLERHGQRLGRLAEVITREVRL